MIEVLTMILNFWVNCQIIGCMALAASLPFTGPIFLKMYQVRKLEQTIAWIDANPEQFTAFVLKSAAPK